MIAGLALGKWAPGVVRALRNMEFGSGSQVNVPIAVLIWLMIIPMMMTVDFGAILNVRQKPRGLMVTLFVHWLVKPFSRALIGWVFFRHLFSTWMSALFGRGSGAALATVVGVLVEVPVKLSCARCAIVRATGFRQTSGGRPQ